MKSKPKVNNIDDNSSQAAIIDNSATKTMMQRHSIYETNYDSVYDAFDDNCVAVISVIDSIRELEPLKILIGFGNTESKALVDSRSVFTIIYKNLANAVVLNIQESYGVQSPENFNLKTFSKELIKTIGVINTSVNCNDWAAENVNVTVIEDGHRTIIGRDLFPQLGISLTQTKQLLYIV